MHLFYTPEILNNEVTLSEEESKHALRVLRLTQSDTVQLLDGKGGFFEATIIDAHPKRCRLQISSTQLNYGRRPYKIQIAVAPTKNIDRIEWFLEKATEIGIDDIYFLLCERSERKSINLDRLEKIVVSAMKQSVKAYKPHIHEMLSFQDFIKNTSTTPKYIAHLEEHNRTNLHQIPLSETMCVLIGPEGDFSPKEIQFAYENQIKPVTLGTNRLRTETAALVACHTVNLLHEMKLA